MEGYYKNIVTLGETSIAKLIRYNLDCNYERDYAYSIFIKGEYNDMLMEMDVVEIPVPNVGLAYEMFKTFKKLEDLKDA